MPQQRRPNPSTHPAPCAAFVALPCGNIRLVASNPPCFFFGLTGATVETSIPVDSPHPSPTRHAVRMAILRPLPVKRALYPLGSTGGQNGTSGTGKGVEDKRKEKTKGGLSSGVGENGKQPNLLKFPSAFVRPEAIETGQHHL
jgi:hypothetical protein